MSKYILHIKNPTRATHTLNKGQKNRHTAEECFDNTPTAIFPHVWKAVNINMNEIPKISTLKSFFESGVILWVVLPSSQLQSGKKYIYFPLKAST